MLLLIVIVSYCIYKECKAERILKPKIDPAPDSEQKLAEKDDTFEIDGSMDETVKEFKLGKASEQSESLRNSVIEISQTSSLELPTSKEEKEIDFEHMGISPNKKKNDQIKEDKSRNKGLIEDGDTGDS